MKKPIIYVNYGVANTFEDRIEINVALKKHPRLHDFVLKHELFHTNRHDFWHDFRDLFKKEQFFLFLWTLYNPSSWIQYSPIYKTKEGLSLDRNVATFYVICFGLGLIISALIF